MIRKKTIIFFLFTLLLSSCQKAHENENALIIIDNDNINKETSINSPSFETSFVNLLTSSPLLYWSSPDGLSTHNVLAREVKILPSNKAVEVRLKEGVRFHDGREFTARDILPSLDRLRGKLPGRNGLLYKDLQIEFIDKMSFRLTATYALFHGSSILASIGDTPYNYKGKPE